MLGTEQAMSLKSAGGHYSTEALSSFKVLIFDCYGTLIDWERGIYETLQAPLFSQKTCPDAHKVFTTLGLAETKIQNENKTMLYPEVLERAYHSMTGQLRLYHDPDAGRALGESIGDWPAFDDSADSLGRLKKMGLKLVVLSNVDNESFERTREKLETGWGGFDAVNTAEDIGTYKPDLRNFHYALQQIEQSFDIQPAEVLVVANSKFHDIQPAHRLGLKAVWIDRRDAIMGVSGEEDVQPDWTFGSMEEFVEELERVRDG